MHVKQKAVLAITTAALLGLASSAKAAFQGRLANGTPSATCTASGATKCTYFFDTTLGITILNNWNIGSGSWSASAAPGSAQALAASAGFAASALTGWLLPTGDGNAAPGAQNQYTSIWNSVGASFAGLSNQFDGVQLKVYWSGTAYAGFPTAAWDFNADGGFQPGQFKGDSQYVVAVRLGDIAPVPEPQTYAMLLMGLGALTWAVRKRPYRQFFTCVQPLLMASARIRSYSALVTCRLSAANEGLGRAIPVNATTKKRDSIRVSA